MYLKWNEKTISDFSDENINSLYNQGYLFGRTGKGDMYQTRSLRIDVSKFELSSENRRVLRKTENVILHKGVLPFAQYTWHIGKLAKDFYDTKFGDGTFSANKVKEIMTDETKSNFNTVFVYSLSELPPPRLPLNGGGNDPSPLLGESGSGVAGYCIALETNNLLHYCYPFYELNEMTRANSNSPLHLPPNLGLGMMLKAILWAKENGKKYMYLGSFSRPTDTYKLQFAGLEWWNGKEWKNDLEELKNIHIHGDTLAIQ